MHSVQPDSEVQIVQEEECTVFSHTSRCKLCKKRNVQSVEPYVQVQIVLEEECTEC
jgi:hypothetical protein